MSDRSKQLLRRKEIRTNRFKSRNSNLSNTSGLISRDRTYHRRQNYITANYKTKISSQKTTIKNLINSIQEKIDKYTSYIKRGASKTSRNKRKKYIKNRAKLREEINYLNKANLILSSGKLLDISHISSEASKYAVHTESYQKAKYKYSKYKHQKARDKKLSSKLEYYKKITSKLSPTEKIKFYNRRGLNTPDSVKKELITSIQNGLPKGDKLIYDKKTYKLKGISSKLLNKSFSYDNKSIERYNKLLGKISKIYKSSFGKGNKIYDNTTIQRFSRKTEKWKADKYLDKYLDKLNARAYKRVKTLIPFSNKINYETEFKKWIAKNWKRTGMNVKNAKEFSEKLGKTASINYNKRLNEINIKAKKIKDIKAILNNSNSTNAQKGKAREDLKKVYKRVEQDKAGAKYIGAIALKTIVDLGSATPDLVRALNDRPIQTISTLPKVILISTWNDLKTVVKGSSIEQREIIISYIALAGLFKVFGKVIKGVSRIRSKKLINGNIVLSKTPEEIFNVKGTTRYLKTRVKKPSIKRPFSTTMDYIRGRKTGQFKKFQKDKGLKLTSETVSSGASPIKQQIKIAGTDVTAVNVAGEQLTGFFRKLAKIRKPIAGEELAPKNIKAIIKRFDSGKKISLKEMTKVNKWLRLNTESHFTLLETSMYFNPKSGMRLTRLGKNPKRATWLETLTGKGKLFHKPSKIYVLENSKVAKLPKYLKKIDRKFKAGKKLTAKETNQYIQWQTIYGDARLKPVGSTIWSGGTELEVTLSLGNWIREVKTLGRLWYKGKSIKIVKIEIYKPSKALLKRIKLANAGKLSLKAVKILEAKLKKIFGKKVYVETPSPKSLKRIMKAGRREARRLDSSIPVIRVRMNRLFVLASRRAIRPVRNRRNIPRTPRKPRTRKAVRKPRTPRKSRKPKTPRKPRTPRKPTKPRIVKRPRTPRKPRKSKAPIKPRKPILRKRSRKPIKKKGNGKAGYYVIIRRNKKLVKLNKKPLSMKDAKDYMAYRLDNGLSRSAWFRPANKVKKLNKLNKNIKGYLAKHKKKFRPYKIRSGKKKSIRKGYIEKRKYSIDTRSEKRSLLKSKKKRR